ncbi:MAG TPA: hypothetical protein VLM76_04775 [Patescibacteria group bacterium]|nr:hypothetical protein [Patescibacteria group bacterium]
MITPTLSHGATTVDLGHPVGAGNRRELDQRAIVRRTVNGTLRTSILWTSYRYELAFSGTLRSTYDALVALWRAAVAAGAYPTFTFSAVWPTADGVAVGLEIGPLEWDIPGVDAGSFKLTLTEVAPR